MGVALWNPHRRMLTWLLLLVLALFSGLAFTAGRGRALAAALEIDRQAVFYSDADAIVAKPSRSEIGALRALKSAFDAKVAEAARVLQRAHDYITSRFG
jgi:phosphate transport system permease protein